MVFDKSVVCPILIGRENDLQLLDHLMLQARNKHGQVALISGEAGVGKSRLVKEAKARAPQDTIILEGQCFQTESALPYAPLLDVLRNFFATQPREEIVRAMEPFAPHLVKLLPELTFHLPLPTSTPGLDPKQEKRQLFQALVLALTELAQNQTLFLVVEDLHWSDSTSLEFLLLLAHRIASQPVLLLVTYRSEETTPELTHFLAELQRERLGVELALKPMTPLEVGAMLQAILDTETTELDELLDTIFPLTEGNPFFLEEILKALLTEGDIFYAGGTWERKEINQLRIPLTIKDAVQRRTQQFNQLILQALTLASVMGRRFDFQLLRELLGVEEEELMGMLKELVNAQLVVEESADRFAFRHTLTREAIYNALLLRERQTLHRTVGEAMEDLYTASLNTHLTDLSYHFYTGSVWQKALEYSQKAGAQARDLYAPREAVVYYSRALVAARQLDMVIEPELLGARGQAYEILGDFKSALDDFERALTIARQKGDGRAEWQIVINLGFLWIGHDFQRAGEFFRQAEELARDLNKPKLRALSLNHIGSWYFMSGQTLRGLHCHRQALEFFEGEQDEQGMAETRDLLGMATLHHGDQIGSYEEYTDAIHLFRKLDDKPGLVGALVGASHTSYDETDFVPAQSRMDNQQMGREALELARQIGWASAEAFAEWGLAIGLASWGCFEEAITHAQASFRIATEIEHRQRMTNAYYALGHIYLLMLQAEHAIQSLEVGLSLAKELGSAWLIGDITTDLANAYLLNGDTVRSRSLLDSVLLAESGHHTRAERRMLCAKGNLFLAEHQPAEALRIAEHLLDSKNAGDQAQPIPALLKLKGQALTALKHFESAEQALQGAQRGAQQREALPLVWQIHGLLGGLYKAQKNMEQAEREFASARQIVQRLADPIEDDQLREAFLRSAVESLPKEGKVSKRRAEAEKFAGLTPRERDVAAFLSEGKSNREIAESLVLSERTVENHVGNILTKLGFTSRAQIAVWAVEKGLGKEKN